MSWQHSPRTVSSRHTSTTAWRKVAAQARERDGHACTQCGAPAHQVDHVTPVHRGGTDTLDNAQTICDAHHDAKTQAEAAAARPTRRRTTEPHPGLRATPPRAATPHPAPAQRRSL